MTGVGDRRVEIILFSIAPIPSALGAGGQPSCSLPVPRLPSCSCLQALCPFVVLFLLYPSVPSGGFSLELLN